ncbi:MAG: DNA-processing protein DprA [Bacillota bacterium]|nr:DNA-processing protein DprA [Bacillota bacterium]MDW7728667.1 DNA-processing protein DprA [Bacillota bacterium]
MSFDPGKELIYLNALNRVSLLGARRISSLIGHFGTAEEAWNTSADQYKNAIDFKGNLDAIIKEKALIDPEQEWNLLQQREIKCISPKSPEYPQLLKQIPFPPPVLYYRGSLEKINNPSVAIVGSRRCTFYGKEVAARLSGELASADVGVISGMALGVDTAAHSGALENSGYTVAVLGCGLGRCYPPRNKDLMEQIAANGAVVSEFSVNTEPVAFNFPQRNRIISGLSLGTVVVEATAKSGALITANYALEQNREVFAVPGNIGSPYSRGCHRLLKDGARLVESVDDILEELYIETRAEEQLTLDLQNSDLSAQEKALLEVIPYQPIHIDSIIQLGGLSAAEAGALLLSLEIKKKIFQTPGKYFCRA